MSATSTSNANHKVQVLADPSGVKGLCCYTTEAVPRHTELLREEPLLTWSAPEATSSDALALFTAAGGDVTVAAMIARKRGALSSYVALTQDKKNEVRTIQHDGVPDPLASQIGRSSSALVSEGRSLGLSEEEVKIVVGACILNGYQFEPSPDEALFLLGSRIEHSCRPNAKFEVMQRGGKTFAVWRSLQAIPEGAPVSVSYLDESELKSTRAIRREALLQRYGFPCNCQRCEEEDDQGEREDEIKLEVETILAAARRFRSTRLPDARQSVRLRARRVLTKLSASPSLASTKQKLADLIRDFKSEDFDGEAGEASRPASTATETTGTMAAGTTAATTAGGDGPEAVGGETGEGRAKCEEQAGREDDDNEGRNVDKEGRSEDEVEGKGDRQDKRRQGQPCQPYVSHDEGGNRSASPNAPAESLLSALQETLQKALGPAKLADLRASLLFDPAASFLRDFGIEEEDMEAFLQELLVPHRLQQTTREAASTLPHELLTCLRSKEGCQLWEAKSSTDPPSLLIDLGVFDGLAVRETEGFCTLLRDALPPGGLFVCLSEESSSFGPLKRGMRKLEPDFEPRRAFLPIQVSGFESVDYALHCYRHSTSRGGQSVPPSPSSLSATLGRPGPRHWSELEPSLVEASRPNINPEKILEKALQVAAEEETCRASTGGEDPWSVSQAPVGKVHDVALATTAPTTATAATAAAAPPSATATTTTGAATQQQQQTPCSSCSSSSSRPGQRPLAQSRIASSSKGEGTNSCSDWPEFFSEALEVKLLPSKGRGLVASKDIEAGSLLLISEAVLLAPALRLAAAAVSWLRSPTTDSRAKRQVSHLFDGQNAVELPEAGIFARQAQEKNSSNDFSAPERPLSAERLLRILTLNGLQADKLAVAAASDPGWAWAWEEEGPEGAAKGEGGEGQGRGGGGGRGGAGSESEGSGENVTGLWPSVSLLNHSCLPTATVVPLSRRTLAVVAARRICRGEEVTVRYCALDAPLSVRRAELRRQKDFECKCSRCEAEEWAAGNEVPAGQTFEKLLLLQEKASSLSISAPQMRGLLEAFASKAREALGALTAAGGKKRHWDAAFRASFLGIFSARAMVLDEAAKAGDEQAGVASVEAWTEVCDSWQEVEPASSSHLAAARRLVLAAEALQRGKGEYKDWLHSAVRRCLGAWLVRHHFRVRTLQFPLASASASPAASATGGGAEEEEEEGHWRLISNDSKLRASLVAAFLEAMSSSSLQKDSWRQALLTEKDFSIAIGTLDSFGACGLQGTSSSSSKCHSSSGSFSSSPSSSPDSLPQHQAQQQSDRQQSRQADHTEHQQGQQHQPQQQHQEQEQQQHEQQDQQQQQQPRPPPPPPPTTSLSHDWAQLADRGAWRLRVFGLPSLEDTDLDIAAGRICVRAGSLSLDLSLHAALGAEIDVARAKARWVKTRRGSDPSANEPHLRVDMHVVSP